ncbi:rap1 GTPase-GDP dissociation stimulator 1-B [Aplochiton taeniatus]
MDKRKSARCVPDLSLGNYSLNNALSAIRVNTELIEDELRPHLDTVLTNIQERKRGAPEQVVVSGILPVLAHFLRRRGPLTLLATRLVAELARESVVRKGFREAGLFSALLSMMTCQDQELLLHAARAVARMCYDSQTHQDHLIRLGAVPRIVGVLLRFPDDADLEGACLLALCNLSDMGEVEETGLVWKRGVSLRPEESVFRGVSAHTCGFSSTVTTVRLFQWAPGQYTVSIEVFQRCSSALWNLHMKNRTVRRFPLSGLNAFPELYKVIKYSAQNITKTRSLKTRMFQTFL